MDNHKLVMISILHFETWKRYNFCFYEDMFGKILGFGRMHKNKIFFVCFRKEKLIWNILRFFGNISNLFWNISEKIGYFNIEFVF
jgi:hypothetical protein